MPTKQVLNIISSKDKGPNPKNQIIEEKISISTQKVKTEDLARLEDDLKLQNNQTRNEMVKITN